MLKCYNGYCDLKDNLCCKLCSEEWCPERCGDKRGNYGNTEYCEDSYEEEE